ncbi:hypothetical protein [Promicromonospora panici]|uniref:hypothetical protein n=1 Tax=Promicromonospora panici TaxID=2219658 RepID=UPI00101D7111|nr:hypothetical protein [Promicromonospora panici]
MPLEWNDLDLQENYVEQLFKVVDRHRANALVWYLRDLEIVGNGLRGLSVPDLESQVDNSPHGFSITWEELVQLMEDAADIHDLIATAHSFEVAVDLPSLETSGYSGCAVVIEIFDSGTYKVGAAAELIHDPSGT